MKDRDAEKCERCGQPRSAHFKLEIGQEWVPAGMGFIKHYTFICPDVTFKEKVA